MRLNVMSWEIPKQLASVNWILGLFPTLIEGAIPGSRLPTCQLFRPDPALARN